MNFKIKESRGITIIALVITIIVLLILAGVSIAMLTGDNGILTQAQNSKTVSEKAEIEEQIKLALTYARMNDKNDLSIDTEMLDTELKANLGETGLDIQKQANGALPWTITKGDYTFTITGIGELVNFTNINTAETNPVGAMPAGASVIEADGSKGIVIKDSNENEWVWVEVPKTIYTDTTYNGGTAPSNPEDLTEEDYAKIETTMQNYATAYRGSYTDTFYSTAQHGFEDEEEYNNWKNAMLKSVYENGGFWIGRYEVGTDTARIAKTNALTTPLIQQNKYPYNFVTCSQAQSLSNQLAKGTGKTGSLMFGIQWDLVLKFMEEKGYLSDGTTKVTQDMLKSDSGDWGNYKNKSFPITNENAKGTSSPSTANSWNTVTEKEENSSVLLTTGATERNSILNIYDLAGNVNEWTLENTTITSRPCAFRGGDYSDETYKLPASYRGSRDSTQSFYYMGFHSALY